MHYLYLITREDGEKYAGVSQYVERRMREHARGQGSKLLKDKVFTYEILLEGCAQLIYAAEKDYIATHKPSLNRAAGGSGGNTGGLKGEDNHFSVLTEDSIEQIRIRVYNGASQQSIADEFWVSRQTIGDVVSGKTWKHIGGPITKPRTAKVLTEDMRNEIRQLRQNEKLSYNKIASKLGISSATAMKYGGDK